MSLADITAGAISGGTHALASRSAAKCRSEVVWVATYRELVGCSGSYRKDRRLLKREALPPRAGHRRVGLLAQHALVAAKRTLGAVALAAVARERGLARYW